MLTRSRPLHPFDHHKAFHALVAAGPPIAEIAVEVGRKELVLALATAASDLGAGFAHAPGSRSRTLAYHRAWRSVRDIDRVLAEARRRRLARAELLAKAQRAIDRADIEIGALPGVLCA